MTDFIHEHPKGEPAAVPPSPPEKAPEEEEEIVLDEKAGQKRVYGYIFILFVVAFGLLLWSFLMNQRSNEAVISELRGNTGTLQSTLERNVTLEQQIDKLQETVKDLENKVEHLQADNEALSRQVAEITLERDAARSRLEQIELEREHEKEEAQEEAPTPADASAG